MERSYRHLKAQLAMLESARAERRSRAQPVPGDDREFEAALEAEDPRGRGFAASPYAANEDDWFDMPQGRWRPESRLRRVAVATALVSGLTMCAGALVVLLLAPPAERPTTVATDDDVRVEETVIAADASASGAERTAEPALEATIPALDGALRDDVGGPDAPSPVERTAAGNSVTLLPRRAPRTARVAPPTPAPLAAAPAVPPVERALGNPAVEERSPAAGTDRIRFAPTRGEPEPAQTSIPPEVIALAPAQLPSAALPIEPQPLAFAPISEAATAGSAAVAEPTVGEAATPEPPEPPTTTARATIDVNMRAGPDNKEPVVTVVPGGATIEVVDCKYWCEVIFEGQRGWIYKDFVNR